MCEIDEEGTLLTVGRVQGEGEYLYLEVMVSVGGLRVHVLVVESGRGRWRG